MTELKIFIFLHVLALLDTLELFFIQSNGNRTRIPLVKKGIAWWTDKNTKFRNPGANLTAVFQGNKKLLKRLLRGSLRKYVINNRRYV